MIDQLDRVAALGCFRAATLMALKRALRNRSVSVAHSLSYQAPEDRLIPLKLWQRDRKRFIRDLNLPANAEAYLQPLEAGLTAGLAALAEAVQAGTVAIDGDELRLPRRPPGLKDLRVEPARQALARAIGDTQLPDVLIEIDGLTRFSWVLLGRPARSEQGEAVHSLQRAIHNGGIIAKHGRTTEQLVAISGALTLLTNIVMAWNTHRLQAAIDQAPNEHADEVLGRMAPIGHKHINLRGILSFDLAQYASSLLRPGQITNKERASK